MKLPQHGALFFLVRLHALENVGEHADGRDRVWAFVEHDALGALPHGGVGDFRAGRNAFFGETFENLGRPDDRNVGGLADPENLFLNFRETLIAALDGQIAAGNHDSEGTRAHGRENQLGQILEAFARFDLQNQSEMLAVQLFQTIEKLADVGFGAHEGIANEIRVLDDEFQRLQVLGGERRNIDLRFRKIDAFFGGQAFRLPGGPARFPPTRIPRYRANHAANFAVVEPDWIANFGMIQNLRQRNADPRRGSARRILRINGRSSRSRSHECSTSVSPGLRSSAAERGKLPMRARPFAMTRFCRTLSRRTCAVQGPARSKLSARPRPSAACRQRG